MKKKVLIGIAAALLLLMLAGICVHHYVSSPAMVLPQAEKWLEEIGTPYDQIMERPGMEVQSVSIPDASGQCLGESQSNLRCFFFGTQDVLGLAELTPEYRSQLTCAGIVCTVGDVYPMKEDISLEQLCAVLGASDVTYLSEDGPGQGWCHFAWKDYSVWIDTTGSIAESEDADTVAINRGDTILIVKEQLEKENLSICNRYRNEYLNGSAS